MSQSQANADAQAQLKDDARRRMSLANVTSEHPEPPIKLMLIGTEGVGKSTLANQAPRPVFLAAERGIAFLVPQPPAFPQPQCWEDVLAAVRALIVEAHEFETLVIDTVDWLEGLLYEHVKLRENYDAKEMEAYGRWGKIAMEDWRQLLRGLEVLQAKRGMNVVLLCHAGIGKFTNPAGADYQRFKPKLYGDQSGPLLKEWCDAVLFATYETAFVGKQDAEVKKAQSSGRRIIYTTYTPAHDAKNRWGLPEIIEFNKDTAWDDLMWHKQNGLNPQEGTQQ